MSDNEKMFLYARAVHSNHSIQYHMHQIMERQRVVNEYRNMTMEGMDLIPFESNLHKFHLVIISQIINMIELDYFWHRKTFESVMSDLWNMWTEGIQELENSHMYCTNNDENNNEMKSVVLSTTEAEYMALSEVVKEFKFIVQLLQTMDIEVELPITVHVDNVGAIWLSNNRTTSDRTKHIDIRTSFVKEYQEDGKIIIKSVKSEENEADIFTKNTTNVIFSNHQKKLAWDKANVDYEMNQELDQSKNQQEGC